MASPEERLAQNITILLSELEHTAAEEAESEKEILLTDVWVGVVLSLMVLSCVCCVCSCFIYHKFQQWKHAVLNSTAIMMDTLEAGRGPCPPEAPLPSYTLVSGLPTYEQALEQLQHMRALRRTSSVTNALECAAAAAAAAGNKAAVAKLTLHRLSVGELFAPRKNSCGHQQPSVVSATINSATTDKS